MGSLLCPECDAELPIPADSVQGEIVACPDCGQSYELQNSDGAISLQVAESIGEDWGQ
ncbi:MAG: lysine biosynthesis protein LysW [Cenarchaeum sp. SB0663_bin_5]|nr:lysine biosynthesis protein LysW [Cenarchaeum sp. SB0663_bin_5]MYH03822.1 lysine biosynthesis protein LysW [Cenarchaeum sp. SB0675_bin_21]MYL11170.1 lysine biosynthesis protein LysW [Cenarchaeum sp. SB0669_bin_11]